MVADDGRTIGARRPVLAGGIATRRRIVSVGIRACEDVVGIGFIATALHHFTLLGERGFLVEIVLVGMKFRNGGGDHRALHVLPGPRADTVTGIDAGLTLLAGG